MQQVIENEKKHTHKMNERQTMHGMEY